MKLVPAASATAAAATVVAVAAFSGEPLNRVVFVGGVMGSPKVNLTVYDPLYLPLLPHPPHPLPRLLLVLHASTPFFILLPGALYYAT